MESQKFWFFLGIALALGLGMEVIKNFGPDQERLSRLARIQTIANEGLEPVYVPQKEEKKKIHISGDQAHVPSSNLGGLAADYTPPAPVVPPASLSAAAAADAKKKADADLKKKKDAADKKKKDKEKKKKKKLKEFKTRQEQEEELKRRAAGEEDEKKKKEDDEKKKKDDELKAADEIAATGGGALPYKDQQKAGTKTLDEWKSYLLSRPDFSRVGELVNGFNSGTVTAEVFYGSIDAMLADPRPQMKEFGIAALGATESPHSFIRLATFMNEETAQTKARQQAQIYTRAYSQPKNLRILAAVLRPETNAVALQKALEVLLASVESQSKKIAAAQPHEENNTGNGTNGGENVDPATGGGPTKPPSPAVHAPSTISIRSYEAFLPLVNHLSVLGPDATTRSLATQTLSRLQTLISAKTP
jgi:hypothetical protein